MRNDRPAAGQYVQIQRLGKAEIENYVTYQVTYQVRPHLIQKRSPESSDACRAKRTNQSTKKPILLFRVRRKPFLNALTVAGSMTHCPNPFQRSITRSEKKCCLKSNRQEIGAYIRYKKNLGKLEFNEENSVLKESKDWQLSLLKTIQQVSDMNQNIGWMKEEEKLSPVWRWWFREQMK